MHPHFDQISVAYLNVEPMTVVDRCLHPVEGDDREHRRPLIAIRERIESAWVGRSETVRSFAV